MTKVEGYRALRIQIEGGIAFATIEHPPINLLDGTAPRAAATTDRASTLPRDGGQI